MRKSKINSKQYYSINEAEKLLNLSAQDIIHLGVQGRLQLYAQNWQRRQFSNTI